MPGRAIKFNSVIIQLAAWLPVIIWAGLIFKLSSGAVPVVSVVYIQDFLFKKGAHMFFFGMLGLLFFRALRINGINIKKAIFLAFIFVVVYGASDEYHQSFTQSREARFRDIGFDSLGGILFLSFAFYFLPVLPKKMQNFLVQFGIK